LCKLDNLLQFNALVRVLTIETPMGVNNSDRFKVGGVPTGSSGR